MSQQQINLSPDLKALQDDGYEVAIKAGHLVLHHVPYVNSQKQVKRGTLISTLELTGDRAVKPTQHVAYFSGEHPCDKDGNKLRTLEHSSSTKQLADGLVADHMFSCKPRENYKDYHEKMVTYAEMISSPARAIAPNATARTYIVVESDDPDPVFNYVDSASTRAGITTITQKLTLGKVAIVGLGGSGSYILDLIAKTPVREIHLFDGDEFLQHNAFRSPGAPSLGKLREHLKKVEYWAAQYAPMRINIFPHPLHLDEENLAILGDMDFVFVCIDSGGARRPIVEFLESNETLFIDVGMGIYQAEDQLAGTLRVTTSTPAKRDHLQKRVNLTGDGVDDIYRQNIQVADLNALNAALAVIKWKKTFGFYVDLENENSCYYTINGNIITNEDRVA